MTYRNTVGILLSDTLSFSLALFKGVLILELGTHIDGRYGLGLGVEVVLVGRLIEFVKAFCRYGGW